MINYDSRVRETKVKVNEGANKLKIVFYKGSVGSKATIERIKLVGTS